MKSIKLLSAMAVVAMFAACAEEDLFHVDNTPQQMNEVVGTKLVGTDISLNAAKEGKSATRMTINGGWEATDLLGLGWLVQNSPAQDQDPTYGPTKSDFFANHMFSYDENAGAFTSKGNIYEGWYLAYYPWKYDKKTGVKFFEVNPAQTSKEIAARMSQGLHVSNLQYVSADSLNADNSLNTSFQMYGAVSYLQVRTTPAGEFVKGGKLAGKTIQSVTINVGVGNDVFADSLRFAAKNIKPYDATLTDSANIAGVMDFEKVLIPVDGNNALGRDSEITTNVAAAKFDVSDEKTRLITIVVPATADLDSTKLSLEVAIPAGKFVIKYVEDAEAGSYADINNKALGALAAAYKAGGKLTATGNVQTLNVMLYGDIFETDFTSISNIAEWTEAVDLVNALGRTEETFKIDSTIVFEDSIYMPESCVLTVKRKSADKDAKESFMLKGTHKNAWPANLKSIDIQTRVDENAVVENAHTIVARQVYNYGTLNIPAGGTAEARYSLGRDGYTLFNYGTINLNGMYAEVVYVDNREGRINLVYGGFVKLSNPNFAGEIAYIVKDKDVENPTRIQNVINDDNINGEALVNILMFDADNLTNDTFSFTKETEGSEDDEDPYNPSGSTAADTTFVLKNLEEVNLDIKNVVVKSSKEVTVNDVVMRGANASLTNVNVAGNLTVTDGGDVVCTTIGGNVVTDGNVTATTIVGTVTASNSLIKADNIGNILSAIGSTIKVEEAIAGITDATNCAIEAATINGDVTVTNSDITADKIVGNVTIKGTTNNLNVTEITGKVTIVNGANITGTQIGDDVKAAGTVNLTDINIVGMLENKGTTTVAGKAAAIGSIVNFGKLYANTDITVATISHEYNCLTEVKTESETVYNTIWYTVENGSNEKVGSTRKGAVEYKGAADVLADLKAAIAEGGDVTLVANVTLDEKLSIPAGKTVNFNLNGKTLTWNPTTTGYSISNSGNLTLSNGVIDCKGSGSAFAPGLYTDGVAVLNNCTIISETSNAVKLDKGGKLTINGGKFVSKNPTGQAVRVGDFYGNASAWELNINGGEFEGTWAGLYIVNNYKDLATAGKALIKNATFEGDFNVTDGGVHGGDIVFDRVKNITIENCTLTTSSIHSETTGESIINGVNVTKIDDVYSELF